MEKIKAYGLCLYKLNKDSIHVLLCKSVNSRERWGFLKGVSVADEEPIETAIREFEEESSIHINQEYLEEFFIQKNELKNIGIYLVNYNNIKNIEQYFENDVLYEKYLSQENTKVKFFDLNDLPQIKKKQKDLTQEIINHLTNS